jgi:MFS family permease
MPVGLAFFADHSAVENRGRIGGIVFLAFYVSAAFFAVAFSLFDSAVMSFLFAIWRGAGLLLFVALKPKTITNTKEEKRISFIHVLKDKTLRLYLIPWVMFLLIDRFEGPVLGSYLNSPSLDTAVLLGPIVGSLAAFFGGLLADRIGRKRVIIGGFVALGLAYAVVGIAPDMLLSWYLYTVADGIAWGILLVTFLLTLWGDLAQFGGKEKYYVIGGTPFYITGLIELFVTTYVVQIPAYAAFSLASFFLFLAVLPLLYAPETLPEKKIEIRRLQGYIEQARKIREKYAPS